ncbi:hypothetical protein Baya_10551 [Bagarius yarrelli]|uniref:Uncharacterized protein n=1 Tax=Bagarius yarrelli TaxID=175774 RepID=A0A556UGB0_BAGYA|nr:hypothetical protein Baya_10551 [Bagarius yarrelli]
MVKLQEQRHAARHNDENHSVMSRMLSLTHRVHGQAHDEDIFIRLYLQTALLSIIESTYRLCIDHLKIFEMFFPAFILLTVVCVQRTSQNQPGPLKFEFLTDEDRRFCRGGLQISYPDVDIRKCKIIAQEFRKKISKEWGPPQVQVASAHKLAFRPLTLAADHCGNKRPSGSAAGTGCHFAPMVTPTSLPY